MSHTPSPRKIAATLATAALTTLAIVAGAGTTGAQAVGRVPSPGSETARPSSGAPAGSYTTGSAGKPIAVPGWSVEKVWNPGFDDWEPTIVASATDGWVYQATTRFNGARACKTCPPVAIVLRRSSDGGRTWDKRRFLCPCPGSQDQYDPQLALSDDGSLFAAWLNGFRPGVTFSVSHDHGRTWSAPVNVPSPWSDKPALVVSHDGQDVYIAFNGPSHGDSWVAQSHNGGATWTAKRVVKSARYYFAGAAWISPDGTQIVFAEVDDNQTYTGVIHVDAIVSRDSGSTWKRVLVDTVARQPDCTSAGCYDGFYGSVPWVAGDSAGRLAFFYAGASTPAGPQRIYVRRSRDGGLKWTRTRLALSPNGPNAVSPTAIGDSGGGVRLWWMDDRTGRFNVWYRTFNPNSKRWSGAARISNRLGGAPYKNAHGFTEDYGDYGGIAITNTGKTIATWGEAPSYTGPGGTWLNRQV